MLSVPNSDGTWTVFVLAGHSLQKWILSTSETEQLVSVSELNRLVRDSFHNAVWDNCVGDQAEIDTWLLDIQSDKDNIIILAAAVNVQMSPQVENYLLNLTLNFVICLYFLGTLRVDIVWHKRDNADARLLTIENVRIIPRG